MAGQKRNNDTTGSKKTKRTTSNLSKKHTPSLDELEQKTLFNETLDKDHSVPSYEKKKTKRLSTEELTSLKKQNRAKTPKPKKEGTPSINKVPTKKSPRNAPTKRSEIMSEPITESEKEFFLDRDVEQPTYEQLQRLRINKSPVASWEDLLDMNIEFDGDLLLTHNLNRSYTDSTDKSLNDTFKGISRDLRDDDSIESSTESFEFIDVPTTGLNGGGGSPDETIPKHDKVLKMRKLAREALDAEINSGHYSHLAKQDDIIAEKEKKYPKDLLSQQKLIIQVFKSQGVMLTYFQSFGPKFYPFTNTNGVLQYYCSTDDKGWQSSSLEAMRIPPPSVTRISLKEAVKGKSIVRCFGQVEVKPTNSKINPFELLKKKRDALRSATTSSPSDDLILDNISIFDDFNPPPDEPTPASDLPPSSEDEPREEKCFNLGVLKTTKNNVITAVSGSNYRHILDIPEQSFIFFRDLFNMFPCEYVEMSRFVRFIELPFFDPRQDNQIATIVNLIATEYAVIPEVYMNMLQEILMCTLTVDQRDFFRDNLFLRATNNVFFTPTENLYRLTGMYCTSRPVTDFRQLFNPGTRLSWIEGIVLSNYTLDGGARGDIVKGGVELMHVTPFEENVTEGDWYPGSFPKITNSRNAPYAVPGEPFNRQFSSLFATMQSLARGTSSQVYRAPAPLTSVGALYSTTFLTQISYNRVGGDYDIAYQVQSVNLQRQLRGDESQVKYRAPFQSLELINPASTAAADSSSNRQYALTVFGTLASVATLFNTLNVYAGANLVNLITPFIRMIRYAYISEPGSFSDLHRGCATYLELNEGWDHRILINSQVSAINYLPQTTTPARNVIFVNLDQFLNVQNLPLAAGLRGLILNQENKFGFIGSEVPAGPSPFAPEAITLQMIGLMGSQARLTFNVLGSRDLGGRARPFDVYAYVDAADIFQEEDLPSGLVVFVTTLPGQEVIGWRTGPGACGGTLANQPFIVTDLTVGAVAYNLDEVFGTWILTGGFNYWWNKISEFAVVMNAGQQLHSALFFCQSHFSFSFRKNVVQTEDLAGAAATDLQWFAPATAGGDLAVGNAFDITTPVFGDLTVATQAAAYADWTTPGNVQTTYIPITVGLEWLVLFGFCTLQQPSMVIPPIRTSDIWIERFWLPEALAQVQTECYRKYCYADWMRSRQLGVATSSMAQAHINMEYVASGMTNTPLREPTVMTYARSRIDAIIGVRAAHQMKWIFNNYIKYGGDTTSVGAIFRNEGIPAGVRPEFLIAVSLSTNKFSAVFDAAYQKWINTFKTPSHGLINFGPDGVRLFELNLNSTNNIPVQYQEVDLILFNHSIALLEAYPSMATLPASQVRNYNTSRNITKEIGVPIQTNGWGVRMPGAFNYMIGLIPNTYSVFGVCASHYACVGKNAQAVISPTAFVPYMVNNIESVVGWAAGDPFGFTSQGAMLSYFDNLAGSETKEITIVPSSTEETIHPLAAAAIIPPIGPGAGEVPVLGDVQ